MKTNRAICDYYYDAMEHLNAGNTETAKKLLKKAMEIDSGYVEAYVGMTAVYRKTGNFKGEKKSQTWPLKKLEKSFQNGRKKCAGEYWKTVNI